MDGAPFLARFTWIWPWRKSMAGAAAAEPDPDFLRPLEAADKRVFVLLRMG
jgi:hypothetical protein